MRPCQRVLTADERDASLRAALADRPAGDVWLFAYGSLIWNPTVHTVERRIARIDGWHRAFCLASKAGRGTIDKPGLVLGLDEGGSCEGVALRLAEKDVWNELSLLWRREMVTGAYVPRWLDLFGQDGACFGQALAFTMDKAHVNYAGDLVIDAVVKCLATAVGSLGTSAEYLFRTRDGLRACGISRCRTRAPRRIRRGRTRAQRGVVWPLISSPKAPRGGILPYSPRPWDGGEGSE